MLESVLRWELELSIVHLANSYSLSLDIRVCRPVCVSRPSADEYSSKPFVGVYVCLGNSLGRPIELYGNWLIRFTGPASARLGLPVTPGGAFRNELGLEKPIAVGLLL
jgi:hypothetical protein